MKKITHLIILLSILLFINDSKGNDVFLISDYSAKHNSDLKRLLDSQGSESLNYSFDLFQANKDEYKFFIDELIKNGSDVDSIYGYPVFTGYVSPIAKQANNFDLATHIKGELDSKTEGGFQSGFFFFEVHLDNNGDIAIADFVVHGEPKITTEHSDKLSPNSNLAKTESNNQEHSSFSNKGNDFMYRLIAASSVVVSSQGIAELKAAFKNNDNTLTFLTPGGKAVTLPSNIKEVRFSTGEIATKVGGGEYDDTPTIIPYGTLLMFKLENISGTYSARFSGSNFNGFYNKTLGAYYEETISATLGNDLNNVIIAFPCIKNNSNGGALSIDFIAKNIYDENSEYTPGPFELPLYPNIEIVNIFGEQKPPVEVFVPNYIDNTDKNRGSGRIQGFNFLIDYRGTDGGLEISATLKPQFSDEALNFLIASGSYSCTDMNSFIAISHASQITAHQEIFKYCYTPNETYDEVMRRIRYLTMDRQMNIHLQSYVHGEFLKWLESETVEGPYGHQKYQQLEVMLRKIRDEEISNISADNVKDLLEKYDDYPCIWEGINLEKRIVLINKLVDAGLSYYKEDLLIKLVQTTPESDYPGLLTKLSDNEYALLNKIIDGLSQDFNDFFAQQTFDQFMQFITLVSMKVNPPSVADRPNPMSLGNSTNAKSFVISQKSILTAVNIYDLISKNYSLSALRTNGQINQIAISAENTDINANSIDYWNNNSVRNGTFSPFDDVWLFFQTDLPVKGLNQKDDGQIYGMGKDYIKQGNAMKVPAIWVYWLYERRKNDSDVAAFRVTIDAIVITTAVVLTPFTGGGSLVAGIAFLEAGVAGIDIVMTMSRDDIINNYGDDGQEFLQHWDYIQLVASAPGLAVGAISIVKVGTMTTIRVSRTVLRTSLRLMNPVERVKMVNSLKAVMYNSYYTMASVGSAMQYSSAVFTHVIKNIRNLEVNTSLVFLDDFIGLGIEVRDLGKIGIIYNGSFHVLAEFSSMAGNHFRMTDLAFYSGQGSTIVGTFKNINYIDNLTGNTNVANVDVIRFVDDLGNMAYGLKLAGSATDITSSINQLDNLNWGVYAKYENWFNDLVNQGRLEIEAIENSTDLSLMYKAGITDEAQAIGSFDVNVQNSENLINNINAVEVQGTAVADNFVAATDDYAIYCASGKCDLVPGCFMAGTPVHTPDQGLNPIENMEEDDFVFAYDEMKKDTVVARIKNIFQGVQNKLYEVIIGNDTIRSTPDHPFFVPEFNDYLAAGNLKPGMKVLLITGMLMMVDDINAVDTTYVTHNFEVEAHHNYFVGNQGILVHNLGRNCKLRRDGIVDNNVNSAIAETTTNWGINGTSGGNKRWRLFSDIENSPGKNLGAYLNGSNPTNLQRVRLWEFLDEINQGSGGPWRLPPAHRGNPDVLEGLMRYCQRFYPGMSVDDALDAMRIPYSTSSVTDKTRFALQCELLKGIEDNTALSVLKPRFDGLPNARQQVFLADLVINPHLEVLLQDIDLFNTWKGITYRSAMSHNETFLKTLTNMRKVPMDPGIANNPIRHFIHGDLVIEFKPRPGVSAPVITKRYPATYFLNTDPGKGGLASDLVDLRRLLNDPDYNPPRTKTLSGLHGGDQYLNNPSIFAPHNTLLTPSPAITQVTPLATLHDGTVIEKVTNPGARILGNTGWDKIKTSTGGLPAFGPTDLRWKKKGAGTSTLYSIGATIQEMEELAVEAFTKASVTGTTWSSTISLHGSEVNFAGFAEMSTGVWFPKSAYITGVAP